MKRGWNSASLGASTVHRAVRGTLVLVTCMLLSTFATGATFDLRWHTLDGGGEMFTTGGNYELRGTIGQPDSALLSGGEFELSGGFWFPIPPGDCNADGGVNLFDYSDVQPCLAGPDGGLPLPNCKCFDLDGDSDVDLSDVARSWGEFTGG